MANPDWRIVVSVKDGEGKVGTMQFYHNALLHEDALTAAQQIGNLVANLTDGVVSEVSLIQQVAQSATPAAAGSDVEIKGAFTFDNADGKAYQVSVPAFNRTLMLPNSDRINTAAAQVAAFTGTVITEGYTDSRAIDIIALRSALEQFTRRRNR